MKILFTVGRGCTAYELQIGVKGKASVEVRWCHLSGEYWAWRPWRRLKVRFWGPEHS